MSLSKYDRNARLTPGLLIALPVAVLILALGLKHYPAIAGAGALFVATGGTYPLAISVRRLGQRIQPALWEEWGGAPAMSLLRLRTKADNAVIRDEWRRAAAALSGIELPTADNEAASPERADQIIDAAVQYLVTRFVDDPVYPLVLAENIHYGFQRNTYAARWFGRASSALCAMTLALVLALGPLKISGTTVPSTSVVAGLALEALLSISWLLGPSKERARLAGVDYGRQLFKAAVIESKKKTGATGP